MSAPVIVVETDAAAASYLVEQLGADGYEARVARGASHAAALARQCAPELVLLGELDGRREALELLVAIRAGVGDGEPFDPGCAVLVLAQRAGELDLLRAFEAGADDVVRRSCGYVELRARARALLRRAGEVRAGGCCASGRWRST